MKKILFAVVALSTVLFVSCNKKEKDPYEGKTNPSTICATNLVAHFPFDGNATELINNMEPTTVGKGVVYQKGRRGQAYAGAKNNELVYGVEKLGRLTSAKSFSFACWLKQGAIPQAIAPVPWYFGLTNKDEFWGQLVLTNDRGGEMNTDSLALKAAVNGRMWDAPGLNYTAIAGRWNHIVFTCENRGNELQVLDMYVNGVAAEIYHQEVEQEAADLSEATMLLFGQWRQKAVDTPAAQDEWMGEECEFLLDEVRFYDIALTAKDAKDLYDAECTVID